ncbi:mitochondrial basic amino acids transporter-like [Diaphorina citri]|uniref:Mitochondrial basic amino acids transporter-like n=1 Tax=Diaphorina citri TaxID=121845 RepID=A0A3Q0J817_DIACI|nr:mitochondrial basic amino acids transporter-like [Diaphorina citri]
MPSYGVYTAIYQLLYTSFNCNMDSNTMACGLAGGLSGLISWALIMPFDVVKSTLQSDSLTDPKYKGMFDCFRKNYRQYGWTFFFRGISITTIRAFPVNYIMFVTYEEFKCHCL